MRSSTNFMQTTPFYTVIPLDTMARYDFATHRLHVASDLSAGAIVPLDPGQQNYLVNVLRMEEGAKLLVFNGRDGEWSARLKKPTRKSAVLVPETQTRPQDMAGPVCYAFAPLKSARLDYVIQKAVEMGAGRIVPVLTRRTQVSRLKDERLIANAIEAAEQCGILSVPAIEPETKLAALLAGLKSDELLIFCDEDAAIADPHAALIAAGRAAPAITGITVLIGPEGGFTEEERTEILKHPRLCQLSLGPCILRADTAGVAAMALVQAALGDWRG